MSLRLTVSHDRPMPAELERGVSRIAAMSSPTLEAIRRELDGYAIEDERAIEMISRAMRVASSAVSEALS
jgi:hypothetical protein